jgi:hypothetical protein
MWIDSFAVWIVEKICRVIANPKPIPEKREWKTIRRTSERYIGKWDIAVNNKEVFKYARWTVPLSARITKTAPSDVLPVPSLASSHVQERNDH